MRTPEEWAFKRQIEGLPVSMGLISGASPVFVSGHNDIVGTSPADIWSEGGLYVFPLSASIMTLSSDDAEDNAAGIGAITVEVFGLDTNYVEISEVKTLTGLSAVNTANSYLRITKLVVLTAGSAGENQGSIFIGTGTVTSGKPAVVYCSVANDTYGGDNESTVSFYTVPAGKTAYIVALSLSTTQDKSCEFWLKLRLFGGLFNTKLRTMIRLSTVVRDVKVPFPLPEKSDLRFLGATTSTTTDMSVDYQIILIDNEKGRE